MIFSIIKTKRNKTATAPTYTTKNVIGKNSKLNKNNNAETLKNEKIKKRTEKIGFFVQITKIDEARLKAANNIKRLYFINI